jgi:DNA-binding transcriptional MerR regulator
LGSPAFECDANPVCAIGEVERLTRVPQREILSHCRQGFVAPVGDSERDGAYFDNDAIQALQRIEHLRTDFGSSLGGIKLIFDLTNEVERLQSAVALRPPLPDD